MSTFPLDILQTAKVHGDTNLAVLLTLQQYITSCLRPSSNRLLLLYLLLCLLLCLQLYLLL